MDDRYNQLDALRSEAANLTAQRQDAQNKKDALGVALRQVNDQIAALEQQLRDAEALAALDGRPDADEVATRLGLK